MARRKITKPQRKISKSSQKKSVTNKAGAQVKTPAKKETVQKKKIVKKESSRLKSVDVVRHTIKKSAKKKKTPKVSEVSVVRTEVLQAIESPQMTSKPKPVVVEVKTHIPHILIMIGLTLGVVGIFGFATRSLFINTENIQAESATPNQVASKVRYTTSLSDQGIFPVSLNAYPIASAVTGDLDGDGTKEIIQGTTNGCLYVFSSDGTPFGSESIIPIATTETDGCTKISPSDPWPVQLTDDTAMIFTSPHLVELNGIKGAEFIIGVQEAWETVEAPIKLYAFNADGTFVWDTPISCDGTCTGVSIVDVALDGIDDIVYSESVLGSGTSTLSLIRADRTLQSGWPVTVPAEVRMLATADMDRNSAIEIFATDGDQIFGFNELGVELSGWPQPGEYFAIGDVVGDDQDELVTYTRLQFDETQGLDELTLAIRDLAGNHIDLPKWKIGSLVVAPESFIVPAISNINNSGKSEIVFSVQDMSALYVFQADGSVLYGWPRDQYISQAADVLDINGDNRVEIMSTFLLGEYTEYRAFMPDGRLANGFPLYATSALHGPVVDDLDNDGDMELVITEMSDGRTYLHAYDFSRSASLASREFRE